MAILITGGAGYIGSSTCIELLNAGEEIVVADNFSNSKPAALERIKEITGAEFKSYSADMRDKDALERIFEENDIERSSILPASKRWANLFSSLLNIMTTTYQARLICLNA